MKIKYLSNAILINKKIKFTPHNFFRMEDPHPLQGKNLTLV